MRHTNLLQRQDLARSHFYFWMACTHSRMHAQYAAESLEIHGEHGAQVSGCVRDHFPEAVKDHLRNLARTVTENLDRAYAARPRGVRHATIVALGRAIAKRDGCGFYGPKG